MLLSEKLSKMDANSIVYIGSGVSFFYIGTVAEAIEKVNEIGNVFLIDLFRKKRIHETRVNAIESGETESMYRSKIAKCEDEITDAKETINRLMKADKKANTSAENHKHYVSEIIKLKDYIRLRNIDIFDHERKIKGLQIDLEKEKKAIYHIDCRISFYKPMLNRTIVECYKRKSVKPMGTNIILEGTESGSFWTMKEYEEANGDNKLYMSKMIKRAFNGGKEK